MAQFTPYVYQSSSFTFVDFMRRMVWAGVGTPGGGMPVSTLAWNVIEAYDGTTRSAPSGELLANLPGGHLWRTDAGSSLPTNSWIAVRLEAGACATRFVFFVQWNGAQWTTRLSPSGSWTVGAGSASAPTQPADAMTGATLGAASATVHLMVLDESSIRIGTFKISPGTSDDFLFYAGEITPFYAADTAPCIIMSVEEVGYTTSGVYASRSIHDGTTLLTGSRFSWGVLEAAGTTAPAAGIALPAVYCQDYTASHTAIRGRLRHVSVASEPLCNANNGVMTIGASHEYIAFNTTSTSSQGAWVLPWDGTALSGNVGLAYVDPTLAGDSTGYPLVRAVPYLVRAIP